jgi:Zn finger protein HypA/HybF involved in hydrogenase expression
MLSSEVCPECNNQRFVNYFGNAERCSRCSGDGYLTNKIRFIPDAPACASNTYTLGTWLRIKRITLIKSTNCKHTNICTIDGCHPGMNGCYFNDEIIVMVSDRMASWLNSEDGKHDWVCPNCKDKTSMVLSSFKCEKCSTKLIQTRDIDLTIGSFENLAPLSLGLIECDVEAL